MKNKSKIINKKIKWPLIISIFLILTVFIFAHKNFKFNKNIETAKLFDYEESSVVKGLLIRNEKPILFNNNEKITKCLINNGEKINYSGKIFELFSNKNDLIINKKLSNINEEIEILNKSLASFTDPNSDFNIFNKNIFNEILNINDYENNITYQKFKNRIQFSILLRNKAFAICDDIHARINELEKQKNILENNIINSEYIKNEEFNGYFSNFTDGLENKFDINNVKNLNFNDIKFNEKINFTNKKDNNVIGKIVCEPCYILCKIDKNIIQKLEINTNYQIEIEAIEDIFANCKLIKILQNENDTEFYGIFMLETIPKKFLNLRQVNVKIIFKRCYGIKINKNCVHKIKLNENDDSPSNVVFVKHLKSFLKKKVDILAEDKDFFICKYEETAEIDNKKIQDGDQILIKNPYNKF